MVTQNSHNEVVTNMALISAGGDVELITSCSEFHLDQNITALLPQNNLKMSVFFNVAFWLLGRLFFWLQS